MRVEYLLAVGQALFLEDDFGAAARVFASASNRRGPWIAGAARGDGGLVGERHRAQADWRRQMSARRCFAQLLARDAGRAGATTRNGAPAGYWLAAAVRGAGDPIGGMARRHRRLGPRPAGRRARSPTLRADLDKLVVQGIIPDRVRSLPPRERAAAESQLRADWELVKERWK